MSRSPVARSLVLPILILVAALALAAQAAAAPGSGKTTIALGGPGAKALAELGVRVAPVKPAKRTRAGIVLPVSGGTVAAAARVDHRGGLRFTAGRGAAARSLKATGVRLELGERSTITAKVAGKRRALFAVEPAKGKAPKLNRGAGRASISAARISFTRKGGAALKSRLDLTRRPTGRLGTLAATARVESVSAPGGGGGGGGTDNGGGPGNTSPIPGGPESKPLPPEPPVLARPASAVSIVSASIVWRPRESWIQYINGGQGTSVFGGATAGPKEKRGGNDAELVYSFGFPFKEGWYDPASGTAGVYFTGGVGFKWASHGIDFSAADPEIEITGPASRSIFRFSGSGGTPFANKRGVLVNLTPGAPSPAGPTTFTYTDMPGTIPEGTGDSVFAGFYAAGAEFGTTTVTFTIP